MASKDIVTTVSERLSDGTLNALETSILQWKSKTYDTLGRLAQFTQTTTSCAETTVLDKNGQQTEIVSGLSEGDSVASVNIVLASGSSSSNPNSSFQLLRGLGGGGGGFGAGGAGGTRTGGGGRPGG